MSLIVYGSYLKEKFFTKVYTSLICLIGSFEVLMYVLMVGFSAAAKEWLVFTLSSIGLASLIVSNVIFSVYFKREVASKDLVFQKWSYFYPKTKRLLPIACLLINFKCAKIVYSGLYGLESCMAKF